MKTRLRTWPHRLALRRLLAATLVLAAAVLAVRPAQSPHTVPMLVAAHDLPPGKKLTTSDVTVLPVPLPLRPTAALTTPAAAQDQVLTSATTKGEPLTRARLLGNQNTHLTTGNPTASAVPFRLADPAVASLLTPGAHVDVVTVTPDSPAPVVLATNAPVLTIHHPPDDDSLVVIALPQAEATQVAAATLAHPVAITLR